jgi:hypothetical protein
MEDPQLTGLNVFAYGMFPVEISAGKRVNGRHRVPLSASVDTSTGEVRFHIDRASIATLVHDSSRR